MQVTLELAHLHSDTYFLLLSQLCLCLGLFLFLSLNETCFILRHTHTHTNERKEREGRGRKKGKERKGKERKKKKNIEGIHQEPCFQSIVYEPGALALSGSFFRIAESQPCSMIRIYILIRCLGVSYAH